MTVRLSPTSLTRWFSSGCPAQWNFSQNWDVLTPNIHLLVGNAVHGLMEGRYDQTHPDSAADLIGLTGEMWSSSVRIFQKLLTFKADLGFEVARNSRGEPMVEFKYEWRISPNVQYVCKVDAWVRDMDGKLAVVDYKSTLGNGWKQLIIGPDESVVPQALGFQSESYLIKPPKPVRKKLGLDDEWPEKLYYLTGPARGPCQVFSYVKDKYEYANFKAALKLAAQGIQDSTFPKVKGKGCLDCEFNKLCYGALDLERFYSHRSARSHRSASVPKSD